MIPGLREKLKAISTDCHLKPKEDHKNRYIVPRGTLGGEIKNSQWGVHIYREKIYPMDYVYGSVSLDGIGDIDPEVVTKWARLEGKEGFDGHDLLFMDTETTGLSGGVGTLAFLVGLGYFSDRGFIIEQHIMRDFDEEQSMLAEISRIFDTKKVLVSFNGKSYDYPLLENRLIMNRMPRTMDYRERGLHIDLLHPSRRIWGTMLDSCSLTSIETNVLTKSREGDIPGQEIPGIYYNYLQDGDETYMRKVLEHNTLDILAMAALFIELSRIYRDPDGSELGCHEWYGLGKSWEDLGDDEKAMYCYSKCIDSGGDQYNQWDAANRLSLLYKRRGRWQEAMEIWESMAEKEGNIRVFPLIEMAKYYEHQEKDYERALMCVDRATRLLASLGRTQGTGYGIYDINAINHRRNRLLRKTEG